MNVTLPVVLNNPKILLIGAGPVAAQKAQVMLRNTITFDVIAESLSDTMPKVPHLIERAVKAEDTHGYEIIIDATGNSAVTQMLLQAKEQRPFMLNVVDVPDLCDFFFAALVEYGPLKVAVSSSGGSPTMAQEVREKIKRMLPESLEALGKELQQKRSQGIIDTKEAKRRTRALLGSVSLVGCGTGDPELLTLKAYRTIQEADVVMTDHLISQEILELIPARTMQIFVGKKKGHHSASQEKINALLIEYASKGYNVARLKAGDPYIFGRGAEEAQALVAEGLHVEVIPGISSAVAGPLSAGIAPTARGYASGFSVVSAHLAGNSFNTEWMDLLKMKNHTTVVLMGLTRAREIVLSAEASGIDMALPCAIVSNVSRPDQTHTVGTLRDLEAMAQASQQPAVMVFGDVVNLSQVLPHYACRHADAPLRSAL